MVSPRRHLRDQQNRSSLPLPPRSATAAVTATEAATATPTGLTATVTPQPPLMGSPSPAAASGTSRTRPFHGTKENGAAKQQQKGTLFSVLFELHRCKFVLPGVAAGLSLLAAAYS